MKKKNAISLIVLVITIIVMAILAATIIIMLSNTNVINEANDAVEKQDFQTLKEKVNLNIADGIFTSEKMLSSLEGAVKDSGFEKEFNINVNENEVKYTGNNEYIDNWLKSLAIRISSVSWNKGDAIVYVESAISYNNLNAYYVVNNGDFSLVQSEKIEGLKYSDNVQLFVGNDENKSLVESLVLEDNVKPVFVTKTESANSGIVKLALIRTGKITVKFCVQDDESGIESLAYKVCDTTGNEISGLGKDISFDTTNPYSVDTSFAANLVIGNKYVIKIVATDKAGNVAEKSVDVNVTGNTDIII